MAHPAASGAGAAANVAVKLPPLPLTRGHGDLAASCYWRRSG
jgi:hypothetical protein